MAIVRTKTPKRVVAYDGTSYKVRSNTIEIPNFGEMERIAVLMWLNKHTYARGHSRQSNPLQGLGGVLGVSTR